MHGHWMQLSFAQENGYLKRKVFIYFIGSLLCLEILNVQSGCPATIYRLIYFKESFEWILAQPSIDFESSAFWIKFSDTSISILHVCSQCIHHMGQGCSDDPLFLLWIIILHWDLSPCSLYCRTARLLWIKDLPLSFRVSVRTGLKSSAAVKVCHNKEAWLNKRNLPFGRILQLFIKEKVKHNT